jgi:glycosyltransferase involved in cell wall biosynthesis
VSNPSNLEADSGYIFQKLLMEEIADRMSWDFYFICPRETPLHHKKITKLGLIEPLNKFQVRFTFEWSKLADALCDIVNDIDIVLVNQPEHSANLYALINTISDKDIPIITYFHYLPVIPINSNDETFSNQVQRGFRFDHTLNRRELGKVILQRYFEALLVSKCTITCSNFSQKVIEKTLLGCSSNNLNHHSLVIPPPVAAAFVGDIHNETPPQGKRRIIYNHRLYGEYGTEKIISVLNHFYNHVSKEFVLVVTDPTNERSSERDRLDGDVARFKKILSELPFVEFDHRKNQKEYFELIKSCDVGLGPIKPSAAWSMAVMDVMACGKPVLCPNYAAFPEMIGTSELLYSSFEEFETKLSYVLSKKSDKYMSKLCRKQAHKFSVENCAKRFITLFKAIS